jgi:hypothetical protein
MIRQLADSAGCLFYYNPHKPTPPPLNSPAHGGRRPPKKTAALHPIGPFYPSHGGSTQFSLRIVLFQKNHLTKPALGNKYGNFWSRNFLSSAFGGKDYYSGSGFSVR